MEADTGEGRLAWEQERPETFMERMDREMRERSEKTAAVTGVDTSQALIDELLLFPQAEHDDLFDGLQTMIEGAMGLRSWGTGGAVVAKSMMPDEFFEDLDDLRRAVMED